MLCTSCPPQKRHFDYILYIIIRIPYTYTYIHIHVYICRFTYVYTNIDYTNRIDMCRYTYYLLFSRPIAPLIPLGFCSLDAHQAGAPAMLEEHLEAWPGCTGLGRLTSNSVKGNDSGMMINSGLATTQTWDEW